VAHILMEITYYGVTEKEIKKDEKKSDQINSKYSKITAKI